MPQVENSQSLKHRNSTLLITIAVIVLLIVIGVAAMLSTRVAQLNTSPSPAAPQSTQTAASSLYLKPADGNFSAGSTVTIEIRENSLTVPVNAVQANISYPADKLEFKSVDATTSAFGVAAEAAGSNGLVKIARGTITPTTGDQPVAKITFTVKGASGSIPLSFATGSSLVSSATNADLKATTIGGTYRIAK
jgi:hypothetical protein